MAKFVTLQNSKGNNGMCLTEHVNSCYNRKKKCHDYFQDEVNRHCRTMNTIDTTEMYIIKNDEQEDEFMMLLKKPMDINSSCKCEEG